MLGVHTALLSQAVSTHATPDTTRQQTAPSLSPVAPDSLSRGRGAADSLARVTAVADTGTMVDTLGRMSTPSLVGTLDRSLDSASIVTKEQLHWLDYRYLGGILERLPGTFLREQFGVGQYSQLNNRGADWRTIAVMANGRLLNDPASGIYNLFSFAPEYADRIEVITGPRAFLYGFNSSGGTVNIVTKNYNSNRPLSKINYTETANNYQESDGTFSQNISRKVNITFGFQHQGWDGRFANSLSDAWNIRGKLRYNLSRDFNIIIAECFTSTSTDLNGGIRLYQDDRITSGDFDVIRADIRNAESYEKVLRHDVDVSLVGTVFGDTTNVSLLTLYYSHNIREYRDEENRFTPSGTTNGVFIQADHTSSWMGGLFTQEYETELQRFTMGANLEIRQVEGSPTMGRRRNVVASLWGKEEFHIGGLWTVGGFGRFDRYRRESAVSIGADVDAKLLAGVSVYGGYSFSRRFPNYQELFWSDSTVSRQGDITAEKHGQLELGLQLRWGDVMDARIAYFRRTIDNPILLTQFEPGAIFPHIRYQNGEKLATQGITASMTARWWVLSCEGVATYLVQTDGEGKTLSLSPKVTAMGGVYYWRKILNDKLDLKVGFKGKYNSSSQGELFNPEVLAYVPNTGPRMGFGSSADFFLVAGISSAYIHFVWENLTNTQYFVTPYYPVLGRAIKLGVSWQFVD